MDYVEVSHMGVSCYSDAFIADRDSETLFFVSLFGRPMLVKAITATILAGRPVSVGNMSLRRPYSDNLRVLTQNHGGVMHKVIFCDAYFRGSDARILVGEDRKRAFEFLDSVVSTPLKEQWADVLWERIFEPKPLFGFGSVENMDLGEVYLVSLNKTSEEVDELVLEGIRAGELN